MENFFTSYGGQSPWVRDDDPVYPCNEVAEEDKQTCYQLVTSRILRVIGVDWEKTAEICASVEKNWVAACFESYGRDVAGQTHRDPEEIREVCAVARPYGGERGVHPLRGAGHGAERQDRKAGGRPLRRCDRRTALGVL